LELVAMVEGAIAVPHSEVSIADEVAVDSLLAERRPDIVFNCAAYNAVDRAETEPGAAYATNEHGPAVVAAACLRHGARLVHFSTNFVFDGMLDRPYVETDEPAPLSVYAMSKLMGERRVLETSPDFLVVRTAGVFGGPQSFPSRILERARSGQPVRVVAVQTVNPTYARDLAQATIELVDRGESGLVHGMADGCCRWDEFAQATLEDFGVDVPVEPITTAELTAPARRPANGCMTTLRFRPLRSWRAALREWAARVKKS
jgi:dTDP-4-dehydrorhamnose reductase